jgi:ribosomal protein S18 acetylase RimI-like enzyme
MPIIYRPARSTDLVQADELVVASMNDLTERHGFGKIASPRPPPFQLFSLKDDPDGLWVAEDQGQMVGFAWSWVCGDLWFLAQLFVSSAQQGSGIGNELIKRTWGPAENKGATNKALITFTFNTVSQGLYIRHGMFPRFPIYFFSGASERVKERLKGPQFRRVKLEETNSDLRHLALIDAHTLGVSREKHHRYLINDHSTEGVLLYRDDTSCVGYAYVADGHIGPMAVTRRDDMDTAFKTALAVALDSGASKISAFVSGPGEAALNAAVQAGMRITLPMVLMSSRGFGNWTQYLPRNPGFM